MGTGIGVLPASVNKNTPPEKNTHWNISPQSTEPGAGEQFLLKDCMAKAPTKGIISSQTPVSLEPGPRALRGRPVRGHEEADAVRRGAVGRDVGDLGLH